FNDYPEESSISFIKMHIDEGNHMAHKKLKEIALPPSFLIVLVIRNGAHMVPDGNTEVLPGDLLVAAAQEFENRKNLFLYEIGIEKGHKWENRHLRELDVGEGTLVVMIQRQEDTIIPDGNTEIQRGDTL